MTHPRARSRLGKYRIERRLGLGAFATVYLATDTVEGVKVAVKIPHAHLITPESLREFRKEARVHAGLDHPAILPIKNAEVIDDHFVIVYPAGQCALADRLRRRMSLDTILTFAQQMLEAVAHAHSRKIIHCDLKPENFIVFPDNRVRLCDFSLAKISLRTIHGSGSGTIGYVAPEQAMGRPSFSSDVFALGLIFWQMLTGELPEYPFTWPFPGLATLRAKVHADFVAWLRRALEVEPRKRFADAGQMLAAFVKLKPRVRRHAGQQRRRRAGANGNPTGTSADWRRMRYRHCQRAHGADIGLRGSCRHCDGPLAPSMSACPWCGKPLRNPEPDKTFPARCPRCKRGRKLDWRFCAWCHGAGFATVADRSYPDRRYHGQCENRSCKQPLMPFMRYCPWCRGKVKRPWQVPGSRDRCGSCGWAVLREYWEFCPWCTHRLHK